ncbi:hypothetical protein [Enorma massiliensis]|uniref:hypothetical protein n=1 Tax=Enorma massiliensis TaxID=1472761 RepID=UPI003AF0BF1E
MIVTTLAGQSLTLENEPFNNTGSEGRLYNIKGKPDYVAKIFRTAELARKREQKLKAMSRLPAMCSLPPNLTWPVNLLYDGGGAFVGFIMKRLQKSMTLDKLFATNGTAMINQRLAALSSLANTLGRMHMCGVAMGDPGPQNIPVLADCTVQLIDTDSFAINMPDGSQFSCLGCTPEYVAPEMLRAAQGKSYAESGISFSEWTDCYALAVLIYKALFGGAHPSSYAVAPGAPASTNLPPLAERERNGWVAAFVPRPGLCAPAGVPAMDDFPPYLQQAFRRTFVEGFKDPRQRTTAFEWQELLRRYFAELVECPNDTRHAHWKGASTCPYCAAEERGRALANEMRAQMGLPPLPGPKRKGRRAQRTSAKVRGAKNASRGGQGGGASGSRAGGRGGASGGQGGSSGGQPAGGAAASTGAAGHAHAASFPASNMGTGSVSCPSMQTASGNAGGVAASVTAPKLNIAASGVSGTSSAPAIGGYVPAMKLVGNTATSKYRRARATSLHGRVLTQASRRLRWSAMGRPSSSGRLRHGTVSRKKAPSTSTRSLVICSTRDPTRGRASPVRKKPCERVYLIPNRCP